MKQLVVSKPGEIEWQDSPEPVVTDRSSALLRPLVVSRSDFEARLLLEEIKLTTGVRRYLGRRTDTADKLISPDFFRKPVVPGTSGIAEIVELGPDVNGLKPGQRVIIPAQLSCGLCQSCQRGLSAHCLTNPFDMFGGFGQNRRRGGLMQDLVVIPEADRYLTVLPDDIDMLEFSAVGGDLVDAWSRVAPALRNANGQRVLVVGGACRATSLYATAVALRYSPDSVVYVDASAERCGIAELLGADVKSDGLGVVRSEFDLIVVGSAASDDLATAARSVAPGGTLCLLTPMTGGQALLPTGLLFQHNATIKSGLPNILMHLASMIEDIRRTGLRVTPVNTHLGAFDQADRHFMKDTTRVIVHRH